MKAKQAEKLEEEAGKELDELAELQEDVELPLTLQAGGELDGFIIQMLNVGFGYPPTTSGTAPPPAEALVGQSKGGVTGGAKGGAKGGATGVLAAAAETADGVGGGGEGGGDGGGEGGEGEGGGAVQEMQFLFKGAEFSVDSKSRIVLLGENGNGKTTLVKLMLGELKPVVGDVRTHPNARTALVNQHHAEQLDLTKSPLQFMQAKFPGDGYVFSVFV
jgi:ATP-binding cassette subfamily F protein 3